MTVKGRRQCYVHAVKLNLGACTVPSTPHRHGTGQLACETHQEPSAIGGSHPEVRSVQRGSYSAANRGVVSTVNVPGSPPRGCGGYGTRTISARGRHARGVVGTVHVPRFSVRSGRNKIAPRVEYSPREGRGRNGCGIHFVLG